MSEPPVCHRCKQPMVRGFLVDATHGGFVQTRWAHGEPTPGWISEVRGRHFEAGLKTVSYRCPACGLLEMYAFDKP